MQIILRASYTQTPNKQQIQIESSSTNYYQKKKKNLKKYILQSATNPLNFQA